MTEVNKYKTYNIFNVSSVESSIINLYINTINYIGLVFVFKWRMRNGMNMLKNWIDCIRLFHALHSTQVTIVRNKIHKKTIRLDWPHFDKNQPQESN